MPGVFEPQNTQRMPRSGSPNYTGGPTTNGAVTLTLGANPDSVWVVPGVAWSYAGSGTLTGGNLVIKKGSTVVFTIDITSQGPGFIPFEYPIQGNVGEAMSAVLAAGGANVAGSLNWLGVPWTRNATSASGTGGGYDFSDPSNSAYI